MKRILSLLLTLALMLTSLGLFGIENCAEKVDIVGNYPDVSENAWYYAAVQFCAEEKIITGYKDGRFGPGDAIQRQDFVVILARVADVNLNGYNVNTVISKFSDVNDKNAYYLKALAWGYSKGIVNGYENGKFGVGDPVTREQICVFVYRYLEKGGSSMVVPSTYVTDLLKFRDGGTVSQFAKNAVAWCVNKKVINGTKDNYLNPTKRALRCEVAQIFKNSYDKHLFNGWMDV